VYASGEALRAGVQTQTIEGVAVRLTDPAKTVADCFKYRDHVGQDVAIEALGTQGTFEACLRVLRPGGTLSSLGVYSSDLKIPLGAFAAGLGDHRIVTTLCPGGKERMRRLMSVIASGRIDLKSMVTHRFKLDQIEQAYELFSNQRDGVLKVAITP
jgi:threonine dehydrogenase-like Zn-dependent dehydrogenase